VRSLFDSVIREDLLFQLAHSIRQLPFEARKDTQTIVTHILRYKANDTPGDPPAINYIVHQRPEVIIELCRGFEDPQSALCCASILKEAVKFDVIAALILYDQSEEHEPAVRLKDINAEEPQSGDGIFWKLFEWIDKGSFEVSADAFTIFRVRIRLPLIAFCVQANPDLSGTIGPADPSQDPGGNLFINKL
jgi:calcium binding protein 39